MFDVNKIGNVELATTAFGQGISVTPIQLSVLWMIPINLLEE